jgi:hypothetical protein
MKGDIVIANCMQMMQAECLPPLLGNYLGFHFRVQLSHSSRLKKNPPNKK